MPTNSTDKSLVSFINQQRYTSSSGAKPVPYKQPQDEPTGKLASYLTPNKNIQSSFTPVFEDKSGRQQQTPPVKIESSVQRPPAVKYTNPNHIKNNTKQTTYINPRKHNILNSNIDHGHSPAKLSKLEQLYAKTFTGEKEGPLRKKKVVLYKTESSDESSSDTSRSGRSESSSLESEDEPEKTRNPTARVENEKSGDKSKFTAQEWAEYYQQWAEYYANQQYYEQQGLYIPGSSGSKPDIGTTKTYQPQFHQLQSAYQPAQHGSNEAEFDEADLLKPYAAEEVAPPQAPAYYPNQPPPMHNSKFAAPESIADYVEIQRGRERDFEDEEGQVGGDREEHTSEFFLQNLPDDLSKYISEIRQAVEAQTPGVVERQASQQFDKIEVAQAFKKMKDAWNTGVDGKSKRPKFQPRMPGIRPRFLASNPGIPTGFDIIKFPDDKSKLNSMFGADKVENFKNEKIPTANLMNINLRARAPISMKTAKTFTETGSPGGFCPQFGSGPRFSSPQLPAPRFPPPRFNQNHIISRMPPPHMFKSLSTADDEYGFGGAKSEPTIEREIERQSERQSENRSHHETKVAHNKPDSDDEYGFGKSSIQENSKRVVFTEQQINENDKTQFQQQALKQFQKVVESEKVVNTEERDDKSGFAQKSVENAKNPEYPENPENPGNQPAAEQFRSRTPPPMVNNQLPPPNFPVNEVKNEWPDATPETNENSKGFEMLKNETKIVQKPIVKIESVKKTPLIEKTPQLLAERRQTPLLSEPPKPLISETPLNKDQMKPSKPSKPLISDIPPPNFSKNVHRHENQDDYGFSNSNEYGFSNPVKVPLLNSIKSSIVPSKVSNFDDDYGFENPAYRSYKKPENENQNSQNQSVEDDYGFSATGVSSSYNLPPPSFLGSRPPPPNFGTQNNNRFPSPVYQAPGMQSRFQAAPRDNNNSASNNDYQPRSRQPHSTQHRHFKPSKPDYFRR